eukprot:Skav225194  [mRNA]  locus=scaffold3065:150056:151534:+ [translate_table: standard]
MATHARTQVYPTFQHYLDTTWPTLQKWTRHFSMFEVTFDMWRDYLRSQWPEHLATASQWLAHDDVKYLQRVLRDLVVHCRDHAASSTHVYCPNLYWHVLKYTFGDHQVYNHLPMTPPQATQYLHKLANASWLKRYKWGINQHAACPISYILMKKKKLFLAARPIISYKGFVFAKLFRATAIALHHIHQSTWPTTYGHDTLPSIFAKLHRYLHHLPIDIDLKIYNQDLAGFFTSIPAERILRAVSDLLNDYHALHPHLHPESVLSIDLKQQDTQRRLFRGKPRHASKQHAPLRISDILPLCKLSLEASIFIQMGQCFQQVRGSAIGNQISPVLANITVSHTEHHWQRTHTSPLPPTFFTCRYVDNRLTLIHATDTRSHLVREFLEPTFYQDPVLLEDEPDNSFLGCVINPNTHTLTYTHPTDRWQFHSWASATAPQHKLSAAFARIHLAANHTFPPAQAHADVNTLLLTYEDLGYPSKPLRAFARRSLANRAK